MGALPKYKRSRSKQGRKRAHHHLTVPQLVVCPNCNNRRLPHTVCPSCGYYKDTQVIEIEEKASQAS